MLEFFVKFKGLVGLALTKVKGLWVPGVDMRLMTAGSLHDRLIEKYEEGRKHERWITNRQMSSLLHKNALLGSQNTVMQHRLKNVR